MRMSDVTREQLLIQLSFNYSLMVATEGLLIAANMFERLVDEAGHAAWLAQDIRNLGGDIPTHDSDAAAIAGAQYYWIFHKDSRMLLGYMAALECAPMSMGEVEALEARHGPLPCLRHHAIHDVCHGEQVKQRILSIADTQLQDRIMDNYHWARTSIAAVLATRYAAGSRVTEGVST